jgi:hypothetical protein
VSARSKRSRAQAIATLNKRLAQLSADDVHWLFHDWSRDEVAAIVQKDFGHLSTDALRELSRCARERLSAEYRRYYLARTVFDQFDQALALSWAPSHHLASASLRARSRRVYARWNPRWGELFVDEISGAPDASDLFIQEDIAGLARHMCERTNFESIVLRQVGPSLRPLLQQTGWRCRVRWWTPPDGVDGQDASDDFYKSRGDLRVAGGGPKPTEKGRLVGRKKSRD